MVSFDMQRTLKRMAQALMAATICVPRIALSQPESLPGLEAIQQVASEVEALQSLGDPRSPDLIGPFTALGLLYQEGGDFDLAVAAIESARQVIRVNYGLYSLDEAPLIRQRIFIEEATGNVETAWNLEQKLVRLVLRHPDDLRTVPILREIADKRMDLIRQHNAGEFPPQIVLGCYFATNTDHSCTAGSKRVMWNAIRSEANGYYANANDVVLRNENWEGSGALACERPTRPSIPDLAGISDTELRSIQFGARRYLTEVTRYIDCVQAQFDAAASTRAPARLVSNLDAARKSAVAELERAKARYADRVGAELQRGR